VGTTVGGIVRKGGLEGGKVRRWVALTDEQQEARGEIKISP